MQALAGKTVGGYSGGRIPLAERERLVAVLKEIARGGGVSHSGPGSPHFTHPVTKKTHEWMLLHEGGGDIPFGRITSFISANPGWPDMARLRLRAEASLPDDMPPSIVASWFSRHPPLTPEGMDAYLSALLRLGQAGKVRDVLSPYWEKTLLSKEQQQMFLKRYGRYIAQESHRKRLDRLLLSSHYTNGREIAAALGHDYELLAEARIALAADKGNVDHKVSRVPVRLRSDPGLKFERLRWRRRHGMNISAMEILHDAPDPESVINPADWWRERHIITRELIKNAQYESAYLLVSAHRQKSGFAFAQAEWLAGWIALEKLERPYEAFSHFERLYKNVTTPLSRSRGAYWAGMAAGRAGRRDVSEPWLRAASRYPWTFYGQMAIESLGTRPAESRSPVPEVSMDYKLAWHDSELAQAARVMLEAGLHNEASAFFAALLKEASSPQDYALLADFARDNGHYHDAVRVAGAAERKGVILPDHAFPSMLELMRPVKLEWALVHALMLQESGFDTSAVSPAGARGLMQLMPSTAKGVARKLGLAFQEEWLTSKPEYNVRLGSAYLEEMLGRFDGSYVLALAAYNAGPGRVSRWMVEFGNPHEKGTDLVGWVEMIPVYETRNYVQRVLEAVYVYRVKFNGLRSAASPAVLPSHE